MLNVVVGSEPDRCYECFGEDSVAVIVKNQGSDYVRDG